MKKFKQFIDAQPVHGKHSKEPVSVDGVILVNPMHGKHSRPPSENKGQKKIDEEYKNQYSLSPEGHEHHIDFGNKNYNDHLGEHVSDVHKKIDLPRESYHQNPHHSALTNYSVSSYETNNALINNAAGRSNKWDHSKYDSEEDRVRKTNRKKRFEEHVKNLDDSFNHPHATLQHDLHVFHGTSRFNPGAEAAKNGGRITLPAFTSTSINAKNALDFAGAGDSNNAHVIHIHLKKGQKAHYLGSNSEVPEEQEALLPRNTTLRIHPKPTILHAGSGGNLTHVWHGYVEDK